MRNYLIILFLLVTTAVAGLNVHGHITRSITWQLSESPYVLDGYVYIDAGVTLTIEPGVQILAEAVNVDNINSDSQLDEKNECVSKMFIINGRIIAIGTQVHPIIFDKYGSEVNARWGGIYISKTAPESTFEYCEFRNTSANLIPGQSNTSFSATIRFDNGGIDIKHCTFYDFRTAIRGHNLMTDMVIYDCKFIIEHGILYNYYPCGISLVGSSVLGAQDPVVFVDVNIANCYFSGIIDPIGTGYYINTEVINSKFVNLSLPDGYRDERAEYGFYNEYGNYYENSECNVSCSGTNIPDSIYCRRNIVINGLDSNKIICGGHNSYTCNAYIADNYLYGNIEIDVYMSHFYNNIVRTSAQNAIDFENFYYPTLSKIYNNVFVCENPDGYKSAINAYNTSADVENNVFWGFDNVLLENENTVTFSNNIFACYDNLVEQGYFTNEQHPLFTANCMRFSLPTYYPFINGGNNIVGDPLFVNSDSLDFHLQAGSPCIDAGEVGEWIPVFDGNYNQRVMGSAPDQGAFEANSVYIGGVAGNVYDEQTGQPIDCARISISGKLPEFSDSTGNYVFPTGVGTYTVKVSRWDYQDVIIPNVEVTIGQSTGLQIAMHSSSTPVDDETTPIPTGKIALNNYPNPFNPETTISFDLPQKGKVTVEIFNLKGQKVKTLLNGELKAGYHKLIWNGKNESNNAVASGLYLTRVTGAGAVSTRKMMLLK